MKKLIFKVDKKTMGDFSYVGFIKYVGDNIAMGTDIYGNYILIKPDEYMELGFGSKPDIKNWKNEIDKEEFEKRGERNTVGLWRI